MQAEIGPSAKIVDARKVRSGGMGGFFAKESFVVKVEVGDAPAAPAAVAPPVAEVLAAEPPTSLLELADLVDEAEIDVTRHAIGRMPVAQVATSVARKAFAESMADTVVSMAAAPAPTPAPAPAAAPESVLEPMAVPTFPLPSTESETFQQVMRKLLADVAPAAIAVPDEPAPVPEAVPLVQVVREPAPAHPLVPELLRLGLPASMLPERIGETGPVPALLRSLQLPSPPPLPTRDGSVVVVAGARRAAAKLAKELARELGCSPDEIRIAEPDGPEGRHLHLVSAADAAAERRAWDGPTVVSLNAPAGTRDLRWASSMLDALEPDQVWGLVGADRKCEDVADWADGLGGVDVLAVDQLDQTVSPAAVLQLGIPVGRIDGQRATPALWAVVLTERLAA